MKTVNKPAGHRLTEHKKPANLTVVGIGSSAGGLEALETLFRHLEPSNGMAFIIVTHQQPGHLSLLPELLAGYTDMPVIAAENGMRLEKTMFMFLRQEKTWGYSVSACT